MREGYLYVYDEFRKEWSAYVVTQGGYLFEFDPQGQVPPGGWGKVNFNCARAGDAFIARCIAVKDAARATKIWLGFSDVTWTPAVLKKNADAAYRQAHMRCIDLAQWRSGGALTHAADFSELASRVAEYATTPEKLHGETKAYVKNLLPVPFKSAGELSGNDAIAKRARQASSTLLQHLLPVAAGPSPAGKGRVRSAAWAFSTQPFYADGSDAAEMVTWATQAASPLRAALVALDDPAGVAIDLNGLALQRNTEFSEDPQRKWKHETAVLIDALQAAVQHGAVEDDVRWNTSLSRTADGLANSDESQSVADAGSSLWTAMTEGSQAAMRARVAQQQQRDQERAQEDARIRARSEANAAALGKEAWEAYTKYFDQSAQRRVVDQEYPQQLEVFGTSVLAKLDAPYLAWLKSTALSNYLSHNFDPDALGSGASYTALATQMLHNASGRGAVFEYLLASLQQDPSKPESWVTRALNLNYAPLIQATWNDAAKKGTESDPLLPEFVEKFHDKFKDVLVAGAKGELTRPYTDGIARLMYQVSGPIVHQVGKALDSGGAFAALGLPSKWQLGLLGAVARSENPTLRMVDLRGTRTLSEATKLLANLVASLGGGQEGALRGAVRPTLRPVLDTAERYPFRAVMLIDESKIAQLQGKSGAALKAGVADALSAQQFDTLMQDTVGKIASVEVKVAVAQAILSSITLYLSYGKLMKAEDDKVWSERVNMAGGVIGLVGGLTETTGMILEKTPWGQTRLSWQFKFQAVVIESRASWFTGTGKIMGVVGGVIGGVGDEGWC
ncbi:T6SS effector BTH_I2691 family protein [Xanthomonas populi]